MKHGIVTVCKSEKGRRPSNEDACLILSAELTDLDTVLIVADGMGGLASGEVASRITVDAVRDTFLSDQAAKDMNPVETLARGFRTANEKVYRESSTNPSLNGMGTTCVAAAIKGNQVFYANLGDSRAYLIRDGKPVRITEDHSVVAEKVKSGEISEEEARKSRFRNIITRAVGIEPDVHPDTGSLDLQRGDVILLCSDGLTGPVTDSEIARIISTSTDLEEASSKLVSTALDNGGKDNITVALAAYDKQHRSSERRFGRKSVVPAIIIGIIIGLLAGIAIALFPAKDFLNEWKTGLTEAPVPPEKEAGISEYTDPVVLISNQVDDSVLAVDGSGSVLVADRQGRLLRVDSEQRVVYQLPKEDAFKPNAKQTASNMAVDQQGNIYISEPKNMRIAKYTKSGRLVSSIGVNKLVEPGALAIGADGSIYIIDGGFLKVIRLNMNE